MSLKKIVKDIIGVKKFNECVSQYKYIRHYIHRLVKKEEKIVINGKYIKNIKVFSLEDKHIFFGYYDIPQINLEENKILVHSVEKKAETKTNSATIGYFDIETGSYEKIASSSSWCWQQGSRLRWHPKDKDKILFNNTENNKYIAEIWDIKEKKCTSKIDSGLYDVDNEFKYGLSLNFSRLQRLRPGYGYNTLEDFTVNQNAPDNDGIFYINLESNKSELIISIKDLAKDVDPKFDNEHYINHISISPNGSQFMFFHIWQNSKNTDWKTRLCVYEIENKDIKFLECNHKVSHYTWKNNNELLVTCYDDKKNQYYAVYNVNKNTKRILTQLDLDGHPTYIYDENIFITDTYPKESNYQKVILYNSINGKKNDIMKIYSDSRMYGEKRCDLHPRVSKNNKYIALDSTFDKKLRKIVLLEIDELIKETVK